MYYNGKKEFYLKQYVIPIFTLVFSIFLVGSGAYIYWATSTSNTSKNSMVVASNELKDVQEVQIPEVSILGEKLSNLQSLEKSDEGIITGIKDDASIIFAFEDKQIQMNLLGIDTSKSNDKLIAKLEEDLLNKNVRVSFEEEKIKENQVFAYVYINNDVLYNEKIIENGLATINKEVKNLTYQNDLIQAQAYAKQLARGVWKR